ncbi:hypothetical protein ABC382_08930 [Lysinibacillus sp. 1P01SD]|uniref:hypothetical protein n=1 Tax=Lysinibacillus sp. 1P01SD TaxID=3132285 RepID=UPI0039A11669
MDTNTATLLSGVISGALSLIGGIVGAIGAFLAANKQIKKQFSKQDNDRVLELRIEKLNEALVITNDFLHHQQKLKGKLSNIEIYIKEIFKKNHTYVSESADFNKKSIDDLLSEIKELTMYKDSLKKYKIFAPDDLNYQSIYDKTSSLIDSYKRYLLEFKDIQKGVRTDKLQVVHDSYIIDYDKTHNQLEKVLNESVECLEKEIKKLLEIE